MTADVDRIRAALPRLRGAVHDLTDANTLGRALDDVADLCNEVERLRGVADDYASSMRSLGLTDDPC